MTSMPSHMEQMMMGYGMGQSLDATSRKAVSMAIAKDLNAILKGRLASGATIIPGTPEHTLVFLTGFVVMMTGDVDVIDAAFAGINRASLPMPTAVPTLTNTSPVQGGGMRIAAALAIFAAVLSGQIVNHVGEGKPAAPSIAANVGSGVTGLTTVLASSLIPDVLRDVQLPDVKRYLSSYGFEFAERFPDVFGDGNSFAPLPKELDEVMNMRIEAASAASTAASGLSRARLDARTAMTPAISCTDATVLGCSPLQIEEGRVFQFLTSPSIQASLLDTVVSGAERNLAAAKNTLAQLAAVKTARLVAAPPAAGLLENAAPAEPAASGTLTGDTTTTSWLSGVGNMAAAARAAAAAYVPDVVAAGAGRVKNVAIAGAKKAAGAIEATRGSAIVSAEKTLVAAAGREARRAAIIHIRDNAAAWATFTRGLSSGGVLDVPLSTINYFLERISGLPAPVPEIRGIVEPYPAAREFLESVRQALSGSAPTNANATAIVARTENTTIPMKIAAVATAYSDTQRANAALLVFDTHETFMRQDAFRRDANYFMEVLTRQLQGDATLTEKQRTHITNNSAKAIRLLGRVASRSEADAIAAAVIRAHKNEGGSLVTAAELVDRMHQYTQPFDVQLVLAFQRAMFLSMVLVGGIAGVEFLLFGIIGGLMSLILRVGSGVVTAAEVTARGTAAVVGPPVSALSDLLTALLQAAAVRVRGQRGAGRKTRRRRSTVRKSRKSKQ
jgi:hypothetical protein